MPAPEATFTKADAQAVLAVAESAPIPNMEQAKARADLFQRYAAWANVAFAAIDRIEDLTK